MITAGIGSGIQPLPVDLHWDDLLLTFGTVTLISYLISLYPTSLFLRSMRKRRESEILHSKKSAPTRYELGRFALEDEGTNAEGTYYSC